MLIGLIGYTQDVVLYSTLVSIHTTTSQGEWVNRTNTIVLSNWTVTIYSEVDVKIFKVNNSFKVGEDFFIYCYDPEGQLCRIELRTNHVILRYSNVAAVYNLTYSYQRVYIDWSIR